MKNYITKTMSVLLFATPLLAWCQTTNNTGFDYNRGVPTSGLYGPRTGESELTIGGTGSSNKDFDDSFGGMNFAYAYYLTGTQALVVRQTINYSNPAGGDRAFAGASRFAFDQYLLGNARWRPFVGVNFGGIYGDNVSESWTAGLEAGMKFYVQPRVFIELMAEYAWNFRHSKNIDDRFNSGQWNWSVATGFTF